MKRTIAELLLSLFFMLIYSCLWMLLEYILDGAITNRDIDNIIMIFLYPMLLLAAKHILGKYK